MLHTILQFGLFILDHIPLKEGRIKTFSMSSFRVLESNPRPYSIKRRIKTDLNAVIDSKLSILDHIPIKEGLRLTILCIFNCPKMMFETIFH